MSLVCIVPVGLAVVHGEPDGGPSRETLLLLAGFLLAVWIGFLLDDPAANIVASLPTPLLFRRVLRVAVVLPPVWTAWMSFAWYAHAGPATHYAAVEFAARLAVALGLAAVGTRVAGEEHGGLFATGGLFLIFVALPIALLSVPALALREPTFAYRYGRWIVTGVVGLAGFASESRDAARRGLAIGTRGTARKRARGQTYGSL